MPGDAESGTGGSGVEIPQPCAGAAFEGGAVAAEARAVRRAGGDVGQGVERSVGVGTEFVEVALQAGIEVGVQRGLVGFLPVFRAFRQFRPAGDGADERFGVVQADGDAPDPGQGIAEIVAKVGHTIEGPRDLERVDPLTGVRHGQGGGLLLEDHAVAAMLPQETHIDPQGACAVVAVGDADEGREDLGRAAIAHQVHGVGLVVDVHRRPTAGGGTVAIHEMPLGGPGIREGLQAELVAQAHRLIIGEELVALSDDADDFAGVHRHQRLAVGQTDVPGDSIVGHGGVDRGFFDGEEPVSARWVGGHGDGWGEWDWPWAMKVRARHTAPRQRVVSGGV